MGDRRRNPRAGRGRRKARDSMRLRCADLRQLRSARPATTTRASVWLRIAFLSQPRASVSLRIASLSQPDARGSLRTASLSQTRARLSLRIGVLSQTDAFGSFRIGSLRQTDGRVSLRTGSLRQTDACLSFRCPWWLRNDPCRQMRGARVALALPRTLGELHGSSIQTSQLRRHVANARDNGKHLPHQTRRKGATALSELVDVAGALADDLDRRSRQIDDRRG